MEDPYEILRKIKEAKNKLKGHLVWKDRKGNLVEVLGVSWDETRGKPVYNFSYKEPFIVRTMTVSEWFNKGYSRDSQNFTPV